MRPGRVGRVGVVGAPVAKAAVSARPSHRPIACRESRRVGQPSHQSIPGAKAAVVGAVVTRSPSSHLIRGSTAARTVRPGPHLAGRLLVI